MTQRESLRKKGKGVPRMMKSEGKSFGKFAFIWSGQFLSVLGSAISSFGLSVWLFEKTGEATPFAISFLCAILPSLLLSPLAGSFADRKNRKKLIMLADSVDALLKVILVMLLFANKLQVWMVYPLMALSSTLGTFQSPAFSASIPMLVEENKLARANGMCQLSGAAQNMIAPVAAGALYPLLGLKGLFLIDLFSYVFAFSTIAVTKIPQPVVQTSEAEKKKMLSTSLRDFKESFLYLRSKTKLFRAVLSFSFVNFTANMALILFSPMILSLYDAGTLGVGEAVMGIAMMIGAMLATVLKAPKNDYATVYGLTTIAGVGMIIGGLSPHWGVIFTGVFLFSLFVPYVNAIVHTVLQKTVEKDMLGRVMTVVSVLCQMAMPVSAVLSGFLADQVFEPLMMPGGALAQSWVGQLLGTGVGRGIGVIYIINGAMLAALCLCFFFRSLKKEQQPDIGA